VNVRDSLNLTGDPNAGADHGMVHNLVGAFRLEGHSDVGGGDSRVTPSKTGVFKRAMALASSSRGAKEPAKAVSQEHRSAGSSFLNDSVDYPHSATEPSQRFKPKGRGSLRWTRLRR
jgi:hypothetical protein